MELQRGRYFTNIIAFGLPGKGKSCPNRRIHKEDVCQLQKEIVQTGQNQKNLNMKLRRLPRCSVQKRAEVQNETDLRP